MQRGRLSPRLISRGTETVKDRCGQISRLFGSTLIAAAIMLFSLSAAIAQAGSTGGTIGKQGKSVSGNEEPAPVKPAPKKEPASGGKEQPAPDRAKSKASPRETISPCGRAPGVWVFNNGIDVVLKSGDVATSTKGDNGTWTCDSGMVTVIWRNHTDRYTLSSDGTRMSGISGVLGMALSATKK